MPKRILKRLLPPPQTLQTHRWLTPLHRFFKRPSLWHINRDSAAKATAIGLFSSMLPIPFQMVVAAALAIGFNANVPLAVALIFVTNPLTMPPVFYFNYRLGAWLLHQPLRVDAVDLSLDWLITQLAAIWKPLLLGCFVAACLSALLGYGLMHLFWIWKVRTDWRQRAHRKDPPPPHV